MMKNKEIREEVNEEEYKEDKRKDFVSAIRENPWIISTITLGVLCLILLILVLKPQATGNVIKGDDAGENLIDFLNSRVGGGVEYVKYEDLGSIYSIDVKYEGNIIPVYVTKDGKYFIQGVTPITGQVTRTQPTQTQPQEVPKSDKPVLEVFLSPYCPYGLQYMKGLVPVFDLLKDKADINIRHIGITHMSLEEPETMRQLCIMNEYGKEKLFDYLRNIIYNNEAKLCYNNWHQGEYARDDEHFSECMASIITKVFNKINVDETEINNCIESKGKAYFNSAVEYAHEKGIHASPTPMINGVKVSGRSPELIRKAVCSAFNQEPEECSKELSSITPSPGIGAQAGSDTQAQC